MTKLEFYELINSYHKEPGEYSPQDIYEIGVAHKQLLKEDKSWNEVAGLVGWEGSGESLRGFVNTKMKKNGILPTNTRVLSDKNVEEIDNADLITLKQELMKERQKTRDEWTAYRKLIRDDARIESFKQLLKESVDTLKELPKCSYDGKYKSNGNVVEAVLMLSDLHIGVECDNFFNKYNSKIAMKRVDKLVTDTIEYCKRNNVYRLNVINLGDCIHGIIHTNARLEQEMDMAQQILVASEIVSNALNRLQEAAPEVIYRSVTDNHSRAVANKNEAIEKENFYSIIDEIIKLRLSNSKIKFENDNVDISLGRFKLLNGKVIMFAHGHLDNINQAFQHFVGASREFVDYVLLAHYHCEKMKSFQGILAFINGSIVGTEQYALEKRLFSKPSQTLLIFENDNRFNISIELDINE